MNRMILPEITIWEMFGVLNLIMCYKFASRRDMLSSRSQCKYIKPTGIGKLVFTRKRFNNLWLFIWF